MKKILMMVAIISLTGCAWIPSGFDLNEARVMTDIQQTTIEFDCTKPAAQINELDRQLEWLHTYSQYKGSRDVTAVIEELAHTTNEFKDRTDKGAISVAYCNLKKKILVQQAEITAKSVFGRF